MKKIIFSSVIVLILCMFTSCRMTKTFTMMNAKSSMAMETENFVQGKIERVKYLQLDDEQKLAAEKLWVAEKAELDALPNKKNKNIAPIIYNSELDFRKLLNEEQLAEYLKRSQSLITPMFLSDKQIAELKRIYDLD